MTQPKPIPNELPASWSLVIKDMEARNQFGVEKYGTPLQPHNGRDSLQDAYEEVLDLAVYLRNAIAEQGEIPPKLKAMVERYGWDQALEMWPKRDEHCKCGRRSMPDKDTCYSCRRQEFTRCQ